MKFLFALDDNCPAGLRASFFGALNDPKARNLADEAARAAVNLFEEYGRLAEIRQAVLLAEACGASVTEILRSRIDDLRSQSAGMKQNVTDLARFGIEQRQNVKDHLSRCTALLIDGPSRIDALRAKIRNYPHAREVMAAKLRDAGLTDDEIQRTGIKPVPNDLAEWGLEIAEVELGMQRANAFISSAPLYDLALLNGKPHVA